jgi:hypothetical protein
MGRTLPSISQVFMEAEQSFTNFRGALSKRDQVALGDLFALARRHVAEVAFAAHALPFETILLAMLLEEHKEVMRLREKMAGLKEWTPREQPKFEIPAATAVIPEHACSAIHMPEPADAGLAPARHVADDVEYVPVEEYC